MSQDLHVIFGGGQIGQPLARVLRDRGHRVRMVKRSPGGTDGFELMQGDATKREFCIEAARGAVTIYHCMNPPYSSKVWAEVIPLYTENLIAAASQNNARLVVLESVYMLGKTNGRPMNEDTPLNPCSRKGEIRAQEVRRLFEAHHRGEARIVAGRGSDFYGPGATVSHLGDQLWGPVIRGKAGRVLVDPNAVHTFHYVPDVAAGLATLGSAPDDAYGIAWMLPCAPAGTMRDLLGRFSRHLGREIRVNRFPRFALKALAPFVPLLREVEEMQYQWEEPFIIDDRRFRERFGQVPEDLDKAAAATVAWAKAHYAA